MLGVGQRCIEPLLNDFRSDGCGFTLELLMHFHVVNRLFSGRLVFLVVGGGASKSIIIVESFNGWNAGCGWVTLLIFDEVLEFMAVFRNKVLGDLTILEESHQIFLRNFHTALVSAINCGNSHATSVETLTD